MRWCVGRQLKNLWYGRTNEPERWRTTEKSAVEGEQKHCGALLPFKNLFE
jgi:hypothetical protein